MALKRSAVAAVAHLRDAAAAQARTATRDAPLADKFTLARLNGGRSPFEVSSNRLLKAGAKAGSRTPARLPRAAPGSPAAEVKDVYSLEYLLGADAHESGEEPATATKKKSPFHVASSKLM